MQGEELQAGRVLVDGAVRIAGPCIGGVAVRYESDDPAPAWTADPLSAPFVGDTAATSLTLRLRVGPLPPLGWSRLRFRPGWTWTVRRAPAGFMVAVRGPSRASTPARLALMASDWSRGELYIRADHRYSGAGRDPLDFPLDVVLFPPILAYAGGAVLHASGVVADGRAFVFTGRSGAGKTTIARLLGSAGYTVLSDERIVLRLEAGGVRAYGTPWAGQLGEARALSAPLAGLFLLGPHDTVSRVSGIPPSAAVRHVLPRCRLPFWDTVAMERLLETVVSIVSTSPCVSLRVAPDRSLVDVLDGWSAARL